MRHVIKCVIKCVDFTNVPLARKKKLFIKPRSSPGNTTFIGIFLHFRGGWIHKERRVLFSATSFSSFKESPRSRGVGGEKHVHEFVD